MNRQQFAKPFMWSIIVLGAAVCAQSIYRLPLAQLDLLFLLLVVATVITSNIAVPLPGVNGRITVSETFLFLALLLYGGETAILLAALDGFFSSRLISRKAITLAYNAAQLALSTYITFRVLRLFFGDVINLAQGDFSVNFLIAVCIMGLVQHVGNSVLASTAQALKHEQSIWHVWSRDCLWPSITYFAGASVAVITAKLVGMFGPYAIIATTPIILSIYLTYRTYLKNLEVTAASAKAEAEAASRAEAAKAQAEQAERHVEELSHYIAEQERIREQYSQIEKLSALGELASGVAHDFNNTLAGILGRAQLLLNTTDPAKIESGLQIIIKTAKDGAKTIKRIQDFARQRRDHAFSPVAVDQLLLDVSEMTRPRWKDHAEAASVHINLELKISSKALVLGDESELREVLVNMVFNAVDAMPAGGTLTLATREVNGAVEISIADSGTGMSDEVRSRIFDPFFTTKGKTGMGLGLAVSYGIIRRHEGTVEVESETGRGTTFRITLPSAKTGVKPQAGSDGQQPATVAESFRTKFLVVDDEESVRELLHDILVAEGHEVIVAASGREALALFAETTFAAVLMDVGLPGMSGWELARSIRERDARIPLAIITGWGEAVGSNAQKAAGVDWVVAKPFTIEQITSIARDVSRRQQQEAGIGRDASTVAA
ncbi:MAG TPA: ATP-binding protein [Pyrinomonadaceae bacterium]|jgi:signal transduction histidine kinase/CheY-like chemotaxis protein